MNYNLKKILAGTLSFGLLLSALGGCNQSAAPGGNDGTTPSGPVTSQTPLSEEEAWKLEPAYGQTLKYGFNGGNCVGACYVAEILGFYEEEGLKAEVVRTGGDLDATATGKTVLTESHIARMTVPIVNGLGMVLVGTAQTGCQSIYVLNDADYQKTSDLVGKNVGIPGGFGTSDHNIVLRFMNHDGLDIDDYNFKVVETSAVVLALQKGELDASLLPDQYAYQFVADGTLRTIRSLTTDPDFAEEPCCAIAMCKEFVEQNPITSKKMARAVAKASAWIDSHTEESVQLMLDYDMMSGKVEYLNYLQGSYDWTVTDAQCETTLRSIVDDYKGFGLIDSTLDTEETLNSFWWPLLTDEELEVVWNEGIHFEA